MYMASEIEAIHKAAQLLLGNGPSDFQSTIRGDSSIRVPEHIYWSYPLFRNRELLGIRDLDGRPSLAIFSRKDLPNLESILYPYRAEPLDAGVVRHTVIDYMNPGGIMLYLNKALLGNIGLAPDDVVSVAVQQPTAMYPNGYLIVASDNVPRARFRAQICRDGMLKFPEYVVSRYEIFSEPSLSGLATSGMIVVSDEQGFRNFLVIMSMDCRGHVDKREMLNFTRYASSLDLSEKGLHLPAHFRRAFGPHIDVHITVGGGKGELFPKGYIRITAQTE